MKKMLVLLMCVVLLSGCGNLFARDYSYSAPFTGTGSGGGAAGNATEIGNYNMLRSALLDLINAHAETAAFRFSRYSGTVADDLAAACLEIRTSHPLGVWAVESIGYDTSRIVSYYVADLRISYQRSAEEIASIVVVTGTEDLRSRLRTLLTDYADGGVFRVYSSPAGEADIRAMLRDAAFSDPVAVAAEPSAEIRSYPAEGANRIFELTLDYGFPAAALRRMTGTLETQGQETADALRESVLSELPPEADPAPRLALAAAALLSPAAQSPAEDGSTLDAFPSTTQTDPEDPVRSTAYGALVRSEADSKGAALGYKVLCDAMGLDCLVVAGSMGGMGAEEHYWNILELDGEHYHVDVSRFSQDPARAFLLDDESLWGEYIWDTDRYPACAGPLRYEDLLPEEDPEDPGEAAPPRPTDEPVHPTETPAQPTETPTQPTETPEESEPPVQPTEPPEETEAPTESEPVETDAPEVTEPETPTASPDTSEPTDSPAPDEAPEPLSPVGAL